MPLTQQSFHDFENSFPRPGEFMTGADFARAIGAEQPTISRLIAEGILTKNADARQWLKELYTYYSESSAGRRGNGPLDLVQERARLACEQANKTAFELRRLRGEFAPTHLIADAVGNGFGLVRSRLLTLPQKFKSTFPAIENHKIITLNDLIRETLNELAQLRLSPEIARRLAAWQENGEEIYSDEQTKIKTRGARSRRKRTTTSRKSRQNSPTRTRKANPRIEPAV